MENPVSHRLSEVIDHFSGGNEKRFAESIGVKPAVINNYTKGKQQSKPGFEVLNRICETYPSINMEWLICGRGSMIKLSEKNSSGSNIQFIASSTSIPVINRRAAANYLTGYQTQEYFEELDTIYLPPALAKGKQYYALQVSGDSMEPTLHDSDYLICHLCDRSDWEYLTDGEVCVVVSHTRGLQVKRIQKRGMQNFVTLISDNKRHPPFDMEYDEMLEIWKVKWKLSANFEVSSDDIYTKLLTLESRLEKMERLKP
jgi:phage repressor protein C with HTH and peptisase S24 domain